MPRKKPAPKADWLLTVRCVVTKVVKCVDCTEEDARRSPWDHAAYEEELEQMDWEVTKVERED